MSWFAIGQVKEGGQKTVVSADKEARLILLQILQELKVINIHLSSLTDIDIKSEEVT